MRKRKLLAALVLPLAAGLAIAANSPMDALRARFPQGIPWTVELLSPQGKSLGTLKMLITSDQARSCLGYNGLRVEFTRPARLSLPFPVTSYGIARLADGKVKIDLTGGTCDAYSVMDGVVTSAGSSTGRIYVFGKFYEHDVATYRVTIR